jgi:uncharacterized protein YkwD
VAIAAAALVLATGTASYADETPTPTSSPTPTVGYSATGTWQLLALANQRRHALGLQPLKVDPKLAAAARRWVEGMAARDVLAHNDALFSSASHRSLQMKALGENVGWNYSVSAQHSAFVKSTGHRANLDKAGFRAAGFAVVRASDGRIWSTEDFGTPAS